VYCDGPWPARNRLPAAYRKGPGSEGSRDSAIALILAGRDTAPRWPGAPAPLPWSAPTIRPFSLTDQADRYEMEACAAGAPRLRTDTKIWIRPPAGRVYSSRTLTIAPVGRVGDGPARRVRPKEPRPRPMRPGDLLGDHRQRAIVLALVFEPVFANDYASAPLTHQRGAGLQHDPGIREFERFRRWLGSGLRGSTYCCGPRTSQSQSLS